MNLFKRSIFRDPVRWAESAVGTPLRFGFMCGMTALMGCLAMCSVHLLVELVELRIASGVPNLDCPYMAFLIAVIGMYTIYFPCLYLYGMRRLLQQIRCSQNQERQRDN